MKNTTSLLLGAGLAALDVLHASMSDPAFDWANWQTWGRAALVAGIGFVLAKAKTAEP